MANNNSKNILIPLAELTFMPMAFYVLTKWDKIDTWQGIVLWFMVFALVQNEYLSVRTSFSHYSAKLYLLDIWSLFIFIFALEALTKNNTAIGYDPNFWIFLSFLWLGYAVWDFLMIPHEQDLLIKEKLKGWGKTMLVFFIITLLCGLGLTSAQPTSQYIIYGMQLIPVFFILWSLFWWVQELSSTLGDNTN